MLYKKYHKNFVRQFKKGVKFKTSDLGYKVVEIVVNEAYIFWDGVICIDSEKGRSRLIPFDDGKLNVDIYVVQEISQKPCKAV